MLRKVVDLNGRCDNHMLGLFFLINHGLINCCVFSLMLACSGLEGAWYVLRILIRRRKRVNCTVLDSSSSVWIYTIVLNNEKN